MCKRNFTISYRVYYIDNLTSITNRRIYNKKIANKYIDSVIYVKWIYIIAGINRWYNLCNQRGCSVRGRTLVKPYIVKFCMQRS